MENLLKAKKRIKSEILKAAIARTKHHCMFNGLSYPTGKELIKVAISNLEFDFPQLYKTYISI